VPPGLEQPDQRPEERHVRRVRHVDPDPHAPTVSCGGRDGGLISSKPILR
jgi:hypothetical protein